MRTDGRRIEESPPVRVAIMDYAVGNLASVRQACLAAGLCPEVTDEAAAVSAADALILPGVGAFGPAMEALHRRGLASVVVERAQSGTPILAICLGMQLLMTRSTEGGVRRGLGLIDGDVVRLRECDERGRRLKVPHVGWNRIFTTGRGPGGDLRVPDGAFVYFSHAYEVLPKDASVVTAIARRSGRELCAGVRWGNVWAFQFHPERSGEVGLGIYREFAARIQSGRSPEA